MTVIDRDEVLYELAMKLRQFGRVQIGRILGSVPTTSGAYKAFVDLLLKFRIEDIEAMTVLRMKSPRALDELVGVLLEYRKRVWP